jgi:hypothetical protein
MHLSAESPSAVLRRLADRAASDLPQALDLMCLSRAVSAEPLTSVVHAALVAGPLSRLVQSDLGVANGQLGLCGHVELDHGEVIDVPTDAAAFDVGGVVEMFNERFKDSLRRNGMGREPAMLCAAAFKEMIDNAREHAGATLSPVAGYSVSDAGWVFVVSDLGRGVPDSMRSNPNYARLNDQDAFQFALQPGVSSKGGRGYGFAAVFKSLIDRACALRFRTATVAAHWQGTNPVEHQLDMTAMPGRKGFHLEVSASF